VLFLGVIYHLRHPLLALDRIHDICSPEALLLLETLHNQPTLASRKGRAG